MAGIYSQGGSAGHRYAGWLETVEAKNFQFGGKVFNGSPSAIYVGSNLVWAGGWLNQAAQRAIVGAFGQRDGMAVIKATNAYLTQLAASGQAGKDKATALAALINEVDYMLVCSLVDTGKYRYIKSDTKSYIETGWKPATEDVRYLTINIPRQFGAYYTYRFAGTYDGSRGPGLFYSSSPAYISVTNADINTGATIEVNKPVVSDMTFKNNQIYGTINGQSVTKTYSGSFRTCNFTLWIFRYHEGSGTGPNTMGCAKFTIYDGGDIVRDFAPIVKDGVPCFIDLSAIGVEGKQLYYYNANSQGAFDIEYTDKQGNTWTPSTP